MISTRSLVALFLFLFFPISEYHSQTIVDEPLFPIRVDGVYGYINSKGTVVIKPQFDSALKFSDGLALVRIGGHDIEFTEARLDKMGGKAGYIDKAGKFVIPARYLFGESFSEGLASVWLDGPCERSFELRFPVSAWKALDCNCGQLSLRPRAPGLTTYREVKIGGLG